MATEDNTTKKYSFQDRLEAKEAANKAIGEKAEGAVKFFGGLPLETFGLAKSALVERGPATFFQETFGKKHEGEVNIPLQTILDDPELSQYLTSVEQVSQNNEVTARNDYVQELSDKYQNTDIPSLMMDLDKNEKNRLLELDEAAQDKSAQTYVFNEDDETVTLRNDLFPEVAFEPDIKFTKKGDISFPYLGLYGTNEAGEFVKKFSSAFKPFDESKEGLGQYSEYIPEFMKSYQNYVMPEYSPDPELFKDPAYQAAGLATLVKGIYPMGKSILKRITKGKAPKNTIKQEPFFEIDTPWGQ